MRKFLPLLLAASTVVAVEFASERTLPSQNTN